MAGTEVADHAFALRRGPAVVQRQQHGADARQRQHDHQVIGMVSQRHAGEHARAEAQAAQMAGGARDAHRQCAVAEAARAVDDRFGVGPLARVPVLRRGEVHSL